MDPLRKRLRVALDQGGRSLEEILEEFAGNWDLFKYVAQYVTLEELNRMCGMNRHFRERCENDRNIQAMKMRLILERKAQTWMNDEEIQMNEGFADGETIITEVVKDQHGHDISIEVESWGYTLGDEQYGFSIRLVYTIDTDQPVDTMDFNIYKRLFTELKVLLPAPIDVEFGTDPLSVFIAEYDYDDPYVPLTQVLDRLASVLIREGFYRLVPSGFTVNSCIQCGSEAKYMCSESGRLYCSHPCQRSLYNRMGNCSPTA